MPIPFVCPHCELETLVDNEFAGQTGACAGCNKTITVPFVPASQPGDVNEIVVGIPHEQPRSTWQLALVIVAAVLAGLAVLGLFLTVFFPAVDSVRAVAHRHVCARNLNRIADALAAYEAENGSLPPAYLANEKGVPMHSWRVLLLPYLGERGIYDKYDFQQAWNSEHNKRMTARMPDVYACPADPDAMLLGETNYMVVVGKQTLFPGERSRRRTQIGDDLETTIAVVETKVQGFPWTEPRDLSTDQMQFVINGKFGTEIASYHSEGAQVLMADGAVRMLTDLVPADFIEGMISVNGGEPIPLEFVDNLGRQY